MKDEQLVCLIDESHLSEHEVLKRVNLGELILENFPKEVFEDLSVWQPAVGCLNSCSFCSQEAGTELRMIDGASVRTIAGAFRYAVHYWSMPFITHHRKYKPGIIFPYLDNDIGSYPYLIDYLAAAESLNLKVRTSTIGWSRKNVMLNAMHESVVKKHRHVLAGVRFSLTCYSSAWVSNRTEFVEDFINAIRIYRPMLGLDGDHGACIDIDFKPDIVSCCVHEDQKGEFQEISGGAYHLVIRRAKVAQDSIVEACVIIGDIQMLDLTKVVTGEDEEKLRKHGIQVIHGHAVEYKNEDGIYYAFYPDASRDVTDGIFFFPTSEKRKGGVFVACWPLREFEDYISTNKFVVSTYDDIQRLCQEYVLSLAHLPQRQNYLEKSFVPFLSALCYILQSVDVPVNSLFDRSIVRDRGMIRNSGRAYYEFRNIASAPNIMVVPDPVFTQPVIDKVWRIFPSKIFVETHAVKGIGKKSLISDWSDIPIENRTYDEIYLIAWEVDAPSHSHLCRDGSRMRAYKVPITQFITDIVSYDRTAGKEAGLLPGI